MQSEFKYEPRIDFDPKPFIEVALQLVRSEDTNLAIKLLTECLPSYYRDNPPEAIKQLRQEISKSKWLVSDYSCNDKDDLKSIDHCKAACQGLLRFAIVLSLLDEDNKAGKAPHIVDMGPGDFTMPLGLDGHGKDFTYKPIGVYEKAKVDAKRLLEHKWRESHEPTGQPLWFIAYEIIEHLENEFEIRQQMDRLSRMPDKVFLSTPLYTFAQGNLTWRETQIAHIRTYTPTEFLSVCKKMFPEYNLKYITSDVQTIVGELNGT